MAIRINNTDDREAVRSLLKLAVQAQVTLYDLLGEIEGFTGMVTGLDDFVREDASNWDSPNDVKIDDETLKAMFANVTREG